jgi:hypothetical protein
LKFWVIAFCWLDSTVSTAELEPELELEVAAALDAVAVEELFFELLPLAASRAATAMAVPTVIRRC